MIIRALAATLAVTAVMAAATSAEVLAASRRASGQIQDTYCLQGRTYGIPGNCQFSTYEQCQAAASGTDSGCGVNPMRAFAAEPRRGGRYNADRGW